MHIVVSRGYRLQLVLVLAGIVEFAFGPGAQRLIVTDPHDRSPTGLAAALTSIVLIVGAIGEILGLMGQAERVAGFMCADFCGGLAGTVD